MDWSANIRIADDLRARAAERQQPGRGGPWIFAKSTNRLYALAIGLAPLSLKPVAPVFI